MRLPKRLNNIIDFLGIIIPLVVDLVMNIVSFSILAPDFLSRIAFIALAIMIVVFVPRAWSKRQFISYAIFVSVVVFADWSFTLATTGEKINTTAAVTRDVELERLRGNIDKTELKIEDLHKQYYEANKRETLQELNAQIQFEQNRLQKLEADYEARLKHTEQNATKNTLTAEDIFNAIPNAIKERRIIPLVVWFLVFLGVQLVVATSIDIKEERTAEKPSEPATPVEVKLQPNERTVVWTDIKAYMQDNEVLEIHVRSSIGIKKGVILSNITGIIDSSYYSNEGNDGNIGVALWNTSDKEVVLEAGERICQGIFKTYLTTDNDVCLSSKRIGGIGSSGK